jgi:branched-chain amino acid transport system permease protein
MEFLVDVWNYLLQGGFALNQPVLQTTQQDASFSTCITQGGFTQLLQQLVNGIAKGAIYSLIALGYTMVYGIVELINFAHGDIFMLGSFIALSLFTVAGVTGIVSGGILEVVGLLALMFLLTMLISGVLGVVVERIAYKPLRNAPKLAPLISAIGMSFILQNIGQIWRGPSPVPFPGVFRNQFVRIEWLGGVRISLKDTFVIGVCLIIMVALTLFVQRTKLGKAMRATAQDYDTSSIMGINVNATISLTFFIGAMLAGAAGIIYGIYFGSVWFVQGYQAGLKAFTSAVLGGIGNIPGAMLGGLLIGLIEAMSDQYGGCIGLGTRWTSAVVFAVLILILVFRPSGILGQQVPEKA